MTSAPSETTCVSCTRISWLSRLLFDVLVPRRVSPAASVTVGETSSLIDSVGSTESGALFASAGTTLADGSYPARVIFRQTQVLSLLFR